MRGVHEQIALLPKPLTYDADGFAVITGWHPCSESGLRTLQPLREPGQAEQLLIRAGGASDVVSWRARLKLTPGRYRFVGRVHTLDVVATNRAEGDGARLRLSGLTQSASSPVAGTAKDHALECEFDLDVDREIEFVAELRANTGETRFDMGSLRLQKR